MDKLIEERGPPNLQKLRSYDIYCPGFMIDS